MTDERRYSEAEVQEILTRATETRERLSSGGAGQEGLTLSELQEIGREVGIPRDRLARAARSLDHPRGIERTFGLPMTVAHTVPLERNLTDPEWERLVSELRETFRARGKLRQHGRIREWFNGNLHAVVEPTDGGWRLRMGTTKGNARAWLGMGSSLLILVGIMTVLWLLGIAVDAEELATLTAILGAIGAGGLVAGSIQLPRWARTRQEQMESIGDRVERMIDAGEG